LKKGAERFLEKKHYTIYSKWVKSDPLLVNGEFVEVYYEGDLIGYGFYEKIGAIGLRVLAYISESPPTTLEEIVSWRIARAQKRRELIGEKSNCGYRLVYADSDGMPGLIVDVYNDTSVVQSTSYGWDGNVEHVAKSIVEQGITERVYLKNDQRARKQLGLPVERKFLIGGGKPETTIVEGRAHFIVNFEKGQKTGFYLDQRGARLKIASMDLEGATVLDLFSYTGAFAIQAMIAGARSSIMVEESDEAVSLARRNLELNAIKESEIVRGRVERILDALIAKKKSFDVIIADPPAFIPSREYYERGIKAYERLYENVFRVAKPGSIVYASTCSHALSGSRFIDMLSEVSEGLGLQLRILFENSPINATPGTRVQDEELRYLKGYLLLVE